MERLGSGNLIGGFVPVVVDSHIGLVQLEVQLQHQRAVGSDGAGFHVSGGSIVHILTVLLGLLVGIGNGDGGVGGAGARLGFTGGAGIRTVIVLIIELNLVRGIGVGGPLGVQVIGHLVIHTGESASGKGSAGAVSLGVPTSEGVAGARGQTQRVVIGGNRDLTVVGDTIYRLGLVRGEVAVIGDTDSGRLVAPPGVQIHVAGDLDGTVGIVRRAGAVILGVPAQEDLVAVGEAVVVHRGKDVLGIDHRIVGNGCVGCGVAVIGHRVPAVVAYLGVQVIILVDLGAEAEGRAVLLHPTQEGLAFRQLEVGYDITADGAVLGNLVKGIVNAAIHIIHRYRVGGSHPLGVQGDGLGGHGLAGKLIGIALAQLVVVPTGKDITFLAHRGSGRVVDIRDGLLELPGNGLLLSTIVHEHDVIAVAGVIEFGPVVITTIPGSVLVSEARDGILVFLCDGIALAGRGVLMMQLIVDTTMICSGFTRQDFHIVVSRLVTVASLGAVEVCAAQRHGVNVSLVSVTVFRGSPRTAAIHGGPLVRNVGAVFGFDDDGLNLAASRRMGMRFFTAVEIAAPIIASRPPMRVFFFAAVINGVIQIEGHLVHIALIFHAHNGRTVARNGLLGDGLGGETGVALGLGVGRAAGSAGLGLAFLVGIAVIVGVLQPVNDGVAGVAVFPPLGVQGGGRRDAGEVSSRRQALVSVPVDKGVAGLGGFSGSRGGFAIGVERRGHIAAAVGLEGEPIALLHLGIQGDVGTIDGDGVDLFGAICVFVPAGDGFIAANGEVHVFKGDFGAVCDRLGGDDTAIVVLKVDVIAILKLGIDRDGLGLIDVRDRAEGDFGRPAGEHLAVLCGHLGLQQGVAVLHDLRADRFAIRFEYISAVSALIRCDA